MGNDRSKAELIDKKWDEGTPQWLENYPQKP